MAKKRWKFRPSAYAVFILVVVLGGMFRVFEGQKNPLMEKGVSTTLYTECYVGEEPDFSELQFFREEKRVKADKLSFDETGCDFEKAGTYQVPVLYGGEATSYQIQVEVKEKEDRRREIPSNGAVWSD